MKSACVVVLSIMYSRSLNCFCVLILQVSHHKTSQVKAPDIHVISSNKLYQTN